MNDGELPSTTATGVTSHVAPTGIQMSLASAITRGLVALQSRIVRTSAKGSAQRARPPQREITREPPPTETVTCSGDTYCSDEDSCRRTRSGIVRIEQTDVNVPMGVYPNPPPTLKREAVLGSIVILLPLTLWPRSIPPTQGLP